MGLCLSPFVFSITFFSILYNVIFVRLVITGVVLLVYESALNSFFLSFILTNVWDLKKTI